MSNIQIRKKKQQVMPLHYDTDHDELYGQHIPKETPEMISSKLQDLHKEIDLIPNDKKQEWLMALEKCPQLCDDKFKLMFLRCEVFNCEKAAKRIVKYWTMRLKLFGDSKAFQPLVLGDGGPFEKDGESLKIGFFRGTNTRDSAGRPIMFGDPSRLPIDQTAYKNESIIRATWYVANEVLKDETAQRKGVVVVIFPKNVKFGQFNRKLAQMLAESIKGCLPIRLSAMHFCHLPKIFDLIFPIVKVLMGPNLRKKVKVNSGSEAMVLEKFQNQFGIESEKLPTEIGGSLVLNHEKWLAERLADGC
jgi:hypothetical protein